jgi:7-keto-8-aminopelargonate synthetase-like enzyme
VGRNDFVFSDRFNHASLIDGCRLSGARTRLYNHDRLEGLHSALQDSPTGGRRLFVTDSVFSMDGDLAPLPELCDLAERFGAMLLVDEAHATGVFGANGRGIAELQGVEHRVAIRVGTLSKAVGTLGGFVAGSHAVVDWLWNRARPQVFSTALPPAICAAAAKAIDIIETEPDRRIRLLQRAADLRTRLLAAGIPMPSGLTGPIVPVLLQSPERAVDVARQLEQAGFLVGAIRPPTVPPGTSRLRITLCSGHTEQDVGYLAEALKSILQN